jgi:hypothetical protein
MGFEMATNLFTKSIVAYQTGSSESSSSSVSSSLKSEEIHVNPLTGEQHPARMPQQARERGPPPAFVVCDVNEDAMKALVRNMSDKFPDFEFRIAKHPAE